MIDQTTADKILTEVHKKMFRQKNNSVALIRVGDLIEILKALVSEPAYEQETDNDRDYEIAQVLERELDDSITIANIMSGIQHALPLAANEQEDERGERQQVIRYVKHDINCQCGKCGTGMMAWEVQDKILTANEQEDEKVHNIHCPECGEFIGVGLLMYNPNASKPYDPHEVEKSIKTNGDTI